MLFAGVACIKSPQGFSPSLAGVFLAGAFFAGAFSPLGAAIPAAAFFADGAFYALAGAAFPLAGAFFAAALAFPPGAFPSAFFRRGFPTR